MLEEQARRSPELGAAVVAVAPDLPHEALLAQGCDDAVGVDAAYGAHALARNGLVVGDDGERLERRLGEAARVPGEHVVGNLVVIGGMREEPPSAGDLAQLEAAVGVGILGGELGERLRRLARLHARRAGELGRRHRVVRDEQERLEEPLERPRLDSLHVSHVLSPLLSSCPTGRVHDQASSAAVDSSSS